MTDPLPASRMTADELVLRLLDGLRRGRFSGSFERGFALSIAGASKRPHWRPSAKQRAVMVRLVEDLRRSHGHTEEMVIDLEDSDG